MPVLQLELNLRDYDAWKETFDRDPADRAGHGVRHHRVLRSVDDQNRVVVHLDFDDPEQAETMRTDLLDLWERTGDAAGIDRGAAQVMDEVESKQYN